MRNERMKVAFVVGGCALAASLFGLVVRRTSSKSAGKPSAKTDDEKLSPLREKILGWIAEVVPSTFGDTKFSRIAPGYRPDDPKLPKGFTTCGYLPLYVGQKLKAKDGITRGGLEQMRIAGRAAGSWVDAGGDKRPKPGDLFGIDKITGTQRLIVHVGVIISSSGDAWKTADAGQGSATMQQALYVDRKYDATSVTLGGPAGPRPLAGWIDIERHMSFLGIAS